MADSERHLSSREMETVEASNTRDFDEIRGVWIADD